MPATSESARTMRIGMVAPPWYALPPRGYGGAEAVVAALVDQLVARGHEVVLIASGPEGTAAQRQVTVFDEPPSAVIGSSAVPEVIMAAEAARALADAEVDLVHDHSLAGPLLARARAVPTVVTMHGAPTGFIGDYYARLGESVEVVAISDAQRRLAPSLNWVATVLNGIDVTDYPFRSSPDGDLLWIGRFAPEKGAHTAIDVARASGRRIQLAGKLVEPAEWEYFEREVAPRLGDDAVYLGEADAALKRELFAGASAMLFPITWEEPFGMVMVEAMACGTPVIAFDRGSVPEVVEHGRSGFVVHDEAGLVEAIGRLREIDPAECRRSAEGRFSAEAMAARYETVYASVLERASDGGVPRIGLRRNGSALQQVSAHPSSR